MGTKPDMRKEAAEGVSRFKRRQLVEKLIYEIRAFAQYDPTRFHLKIALLRCINRQLRHIRERETAVLDVAHLDD